jgi:hypothetical protein
MYLADVNTSESKFIESLVQVVPDLKTQEVEVITTGQSSTSSSTAALRSNHPRRMSLSDIVLVYNVTHLVDEEDGTSLDSVYNDLINEITTVSTGSTSSPLATALRSTGTPYLSTTMTDSPPEISTYSVYTQHSPYPTSIPTSAPSCGIGSEDGSSSEGCQKCPPGTYREFNDDQCKECDYGTYCDSYGCETCQECAYPWTTTQTGQTSCKAIQLHLPGLLVYSLLIIIIVLYFMIIFFLSHAKLACLAIMTLPLFDILTDFLYLTLSAFYGLEPFIACTIILTIIPNIVFLGIILQQKAMPRIFGQKYFLKLLFLNTSQLSPSGYPTMARTKNEIFKPFLVHDSILKIFYFILCWVIVLFGQLIALLPAGCLILFHLPFWFF